MAEQQIYHGLVELQQHLRLFFSSRYHWPSASILVSGIDRWVIAMWCHWLLSLHGLYQPAPIAVWAKCHKNSLSYVVFVFAISDFSPLQLRALFAFEFIGLGRVLSNLEIPFQALMVNLKYTNKENYRRKVKVIQLETCCFHAPYLNSCSRS